MAESKLSTILLALVWVSFVAVIFAGVSSQLANNYEVDYDETEIGVYNKLSTLDTSVGGLQNDTEIEEGDLGDDIIGGYLGSGYKALQNAGAGFSIYYNMSQSAQTTEALRFLPFKAELFTALSLSLLILIIIGILLRAILKVNI